jgi:hypothetical protein
LRTNIYFKWLLSRGKRHQEVWRYASRKRAKEGHVILERMRRFACEFDFTGGKVREAASDSHVPYNTL